MSPKNSEGIVNKDSTLDNEPNPVVNVVATSNTTKEQKKMTKEEQTNNQSEKAASIATEQVNRMSEETKQKLLELYKAVGWGISSEEADIDVNMTNEAGNGLLYELVDTYIYSKRHEMEEQYTPKLKSIGWLLSKKDELKLNLCATNRAEVDTPIERALISMDKALTALMEPYALEAFGISDEDTAPPQDLATQMRRFEYHCSVELEHDHFTKTLITNMKKTSFTEDELKILGELKAQVLLEFDNSE